MKISKKVKEDKMEILIIGALPILILATITFVILGLERPFPMK